GAHRRQRADARADHLRAGPARRLARCINDPTGNRAQADAIPVWLIAKSRSCLSFSPMRREFGIIATDSLSRDGIRVAPRVLFNMLADRWSSGMPQLVMHDAHRVVGWVFPDKLMIEPGATRLHAALHFPENAEDQTTIDEAYQAREAERNNEIPQQRVDQL